MKTLWNQEKGCRVWKWKLIKNETMPGSRRVVMQQHKPPSKEGLKKQDTRETPVTNGYQREWRVLWCLPRVLYASVLSHVALWFSKSARVLVVQTPVRSKDGSEYRVRTCEEYRLATRILQQQEELSTYFPELEREYEKVVSFRMRLRETITGEVDA